MTFKLSFYGLMFFLLMAIFGFWEGLFALSPDSERGGARFLFAATLARSLGAWVNVDARKTRFAQPLDYAYFLSTTFPVLILHYLFKTRGLRAFLPVIVAAALFVFAWILGIAIGGTTNRVAPVGFIEP